MAALRRAIAIDPSTRLIDLGGGTGVLTEVLSQGAAEVVVLEPARRKAEAGRRRRPGFRFAEAMAERIPFEAQRFDRVVSTMAYHHFRDQDRVISEVRRVLAPGGRLVLCDLDPETPLGRRASWLERVLLRRGYRFETRAQLSARCVAQGLRVRSTESVGATYILSADGNPRG